MRNNNRGAVVAPQTKNIDMERRKKIDTSLPERYGILHLLEGLQKDSVTMDEMDEIGAKLKKAGRRALSPLVRKLWRERSGDLISRYAYLLDFFDDETWLDQLVQMALRRRDLETEGKAAFLAALEAYGVDVSTPPFARLLAEVGGPLSLTLPRLLDRGEEGILGFIEDLLGFPPETRLAIIRELPTVPDPRVLSLLEVLLWVDDREVKRETVIALGRVRSAAAAALLCTLEDTTDASLKELARKSLRRLLFLGIAAVPRPVSRELPFHECFASPIDGAGYRTLWLARRQEDGLLGALYMEIHESRGMTSAWGGSDLTDEECARHVTEICCEEELLAVAAEYALVLLRDACHRSREYGTFLPAEFYIRRGMFQTADVMPVPYAPEVTLCNRPGLAGASRLVAESAELLDDDCFAGWFLTTPRVYDYAEEWIALDKSEGRSHTLRMESLLERFCRELIVPDIELIQRRLLLTADLMQHTGRARELVERAVAAAAGLAMPQLKLWQQPFFRRYALDSMQIAREALGEGYDPRLGHDDGDDGEFC
jgi:hypothetical protein